MFIGALHSGYVIPKIIFINSTYLSKHEVSAYISGALELFLSALDLEPSPVRLLHTHTHTCMCRIIKTYDDRKGCFEEIGERLKIRNKCCY